MLAAVMAGMRIIEAIWLTKGLLDKLKASLARSRDDIDFLLPWTSHANLYSEVLVLGETIPAPAMVVRAADGQTLFQDIIPPTDFVETASGMLVGWRLWGEMRRRSLDRVEEVERWSSRIAGALLLLLALYIVVDAGRRLLGFGREAEESLIGIVLTGISLVVMPFLGWAKLRTAQALASRSLRVDAFQTIACAWLSLTTLVGLVLNAWLGWQWADPAAALLLVPLIAREGLEGLRA